MFSPQCHVTFCRDFFRQRKMTIELCHLVCGPQEKDFHHLMLLYSHHHYIDLRTSMNERTHFFIKILVSLLFSKGLTFLWCVRDGWRQGHSGLPVFNSLNGRWHLPIFFHNVHLLLLLLPLIYTGAYNNAWIALCLI